MKTNAVHPHLGNRILKLGTMCFIASAALSCIGSPKFVVRSMNNELAVERRVAVAYLNPTEGSKVQGKVSFFKETGGIRIIADVRGLGKNKKHGFHIHEIGDCSAPDGSSAGGHFNPLGHDHAGPSSQIRHAGDLGNLKSTKAGSAMYVEFNDALSFDGINSIIGKSVVVHAGADDLSSQPSGDSGHRVACGVIEWEVKGQVLSGIIW